MINIKKVNDLIKSNRYTKTELSKQSGLSKVTIDKILKGGEVNVSSLESLANALGVSVGFFFEDTNNIERISTTQGSASVIGQGSAQVGINMEEHNELITLRAEIKFLKEMLKEKNERIAELKELVQIYKAKPSNS